MALKRPFSELDWQLTPEAVRNYIQKPEGTLHDMQQWVETHEKRIKALELQTQKNYRNFSKPPSSDPPFRRQKRKQKKSKQSKGGQTGNKPHQQQLLEPTKRHLLMPKRYICEHSVFDQEKMQFFLHLLTYRAHQKSQPLYSTQMRLSQLRKGGESQSAICAVDRLRSTVHRICWRIKRHQKHRFKNEKRLCFLSKFSPIEHPAWVTRPLMGDPHFIKLNAIARDITDRKQSEVALRESEERYRALFEQGPDGVVVLEPETARIIEFNDQACRQLGYSREEFARLRVPDIEAKETAVETKTHIQNVLTNGYDDVETLQRTKQGEHRHVHVTAQVIKIAGRPVYHCIWRDITDRKRVEEALIESENKFRNIAERSPMGMHMYQLEPDGRLVFFDSNTAADIILGVDNKQFIGKTLEEAFPPLVETGVPEAYRRAAEDGIQWDTEQIMYEDNKIKGAFYVHAFQTNPGKMVAMFMDITERKRAEVERENL